MQFKERYDKLNKAQKKAVDSIDGPLLVVAGPGSGKTEILSLRVAKILKEAQVLPSNILCLTFTESAALNMRDRLSKLIGHEAYRVSIHTFHNFCVDIIQKYPEFFYKGAIFAPADPISQITILEEIFEALPYDHPLRSVHPEKGFVYLGDVMRSIGNLKKSGITPKEFQDILAANKADMAYVREKVVPILDKKVSKETANELRVAVDELRRYAAAASASKAAKASVQPKKQPKKDAVAKGDQSKDQAENQSDSLDQVVTDSLFKPLAESVAWSLDEALALAEKSGKNEPISKWKAKWLKQNDAGEKVFRDELNQDKMDALAGIYGTYREEMHKRSLFDFDDMILDTIAAIESNPRLRYDLQEQYQYMLVDEFQDTNNAQMRILKLIAEAPVNEGRPNIMVVGDDDQAVYKFQGAELSNILNFKTLYRDVGVVTMTSNYRSTQEILDVATHIIRKGEGRLENLFPEMEKTLVSSNPDIKAGSIFHKEFDTSLHEYHFVSRQIRELIDSGVPAEDIAVIARKHKQLESLVPYMKGARVPIRYEREQNVFLEPHIEQLIVMSRFINTLASKDRDEADEFMPRILSFPFWNISRRAIWEISRDAGKQRKTWIECMLESENPNLRKIAEFFIDLGARALSEPLEKVLDIMIGAHVQLVSDSEDEEDGESEPANVSQPDAFADIDRGDGAEMASPFKSYYFSKERFEHARSEYLSFLSSLRVFVGALREYKGKAGNADTLLIRDLIDFVDIHEKNEVALNDESPFASARNAVHLLSAHKAKGLEFNTVFVLSCQDEVWAGRGMIKKLTMPINMQIDPAGDSEDDQLRLFYVALTRAKHNLYLTSYRIKDDGAQSMKLRFLLPPENAEEALKKEALQKLYTPESVQGDASGVDDAINDATKSASRGASKGVNEGAAKGEKRGEKKGQSPYSPETHELLTASWLLYHTPPFLGEEEELLRSLLENYQLSVTHLNNFLNVAKGGPQLFLEQNLLRFPQAKSPSSSYGSAVHETLERVSVHQRFEGRLPTKEEVNEWFIQYLKKERMSKIDFKIFSEKGLNSLGIFYDKKIETFSPKDKTEVNFKDQGVYISCASLAGFGGKKERVDQKERAMSDGGSRDGGNVVPEAHLTGKIDRIVDLGGGRLEVHDYKTGKAKETWDAKDDYEKIKLHEYERQLIFYKLLVENSKDYRSYKVERGMLEFVEPLPGKKGHERLAELSIDIDSEKVDRVHELACIVYQKIMSLDFPDTSKYSLDLDGIQAFEDDLLGV